MRNEQVPPHNQPVELCALMRNVISTNLACNMCVHDQAKSSYHAYAHKSLKCKNIFKTYRWGLSFFEVFIKHCIHCVFERLWKNININIIIIMARPVVSDDGDSDSHSHLHVCTVGLK